MPESAQGETNPAAAIRWDIVLAFCNEKFADMQKQLQGIHRTVENLSARQDNSPPATSSSDTVMQSPSIYTWAGIPTSSPANTDPSLLHVQSALARTNDLLRVPISTSASSSGPERSTSTSASTSFLSASPSDTSSSVSEDCKNEAVLENIPPESKNCLTASASVSAPGSAGVSASVSASVSAPASADASASMSADGFACAPVPDGVSASACAHSSASAPVPGSASASTSVSTPLPSPTPTPASASTSVSNSAPTPSPSEGPFDSSPFISEDRNNKTLSEHFNSTSAIAFKLTSDSKTVPLILKGDIPKGAPSTSASPQGRIRLKELFYKHSYGWDTG